ncbi:hypothetical protein LTR08_004758 [Meristemomyces frigidus]|nr:hypothetical protein LTR08_004758 [Meristemomyces frigidus]
MPALAIGPVLHPETDVHLLQNRIASLRDTVKPDERIIIALAGAPGSRKSTVTARLLAELNCRGVKDVAVVPMDGFHYPKAVLATLLDPIRSLSRRGAPFTFDAAAFVRTVITLRAVRVTEDDDPTLAIWLPSFDHAVQDLVPGDICISSTVRVLIIEGNYTLFSQPPWSAMAELAHEK